MITHLYARNFGDLGAGVQIELGALTVLAGPEGAGKRGLADVLRFLAECASGAFGQAVGLDTRASTRWGAAPEAEVRLGVGVSNAQGYGFWWMHLGPGSREGEGELRVNGESAAWWKRLPSTPNAAPALTAIFEADGGPEGAAFDRLKGSPKGFSRRGRGTRSALAYRGIAPIAVTSARLLLPLLPESPLTPIVDELRRAVLYALPPRVLRAPQKQNPSRRLRASGDNWASVLRAIENERWRGDLLAALSRLIGVDELRVTQVGGLLVPELRRGVDPDGAGRWAAASEAPEREVRLAAMVTALAQDPAPGFAGFELVESFADEATLPELLGYLRGVSSRRQLLLTTADPALVGLLPGADCYAVERRGGATVASRRGPTTA